MFLKILNNNRSNILLLVALLVYNGLFFSERFGLNILLFTVLIFAFQYFLFRESFKSSNVLVCVGLTLFTAFMVVWHNSLLSKWMFFISYAVTLGFILQPLLRFIGYSLLSAASNFAKLPMEIFAWNRPEAMPAQRKFKFSKAFMLSVWDVNDAGTLRIDLWNKEMMVEEMQRFVFDTMNSLANTYLNATNDTEIANEIRDFSNAIGKKMKVIG